MDDSILMSPPFAPDEAVAHCEYCKEPLYENAVAWYSAADIDDNLFCCKEHCLWWLEEQIDSKIL